ncbi:MAG: hypothetical protein ACLR23_27450 [Clostridia bacterium]
MDWRYRRFKGMCEHLNLDDWKAQKADLLGCDGRGGTHLFVHRGGIPRQKNG